MSGSRFSGIAVAAANRRALERQEREDVMRSSITAPKQLSHKEETILAQLKAQLLGGGGGGGEAKKTKKKPAIEPAPAAPREDIRRYNDVEDIEADDDDEEDHHGDDHAHAAKVTAPHEKKYMSHAERKRLKKQKKGGGGGAGGGAGGAGGKPEKSLTVSEGGVKKKKKKKVKEGAVAAPEPADATHRKRKLKTKPTKAPREPAWPPKRPR